MKAGCRKATCAVSNNPAMRSIPVAGPSITQMEIGYVTEAVKTVWFDKANVFHQCLESALAARHGRRFATALPSCIFGLHLKLAAQGFGPGDEVIAPKLTWIANSTLIDVHRKLGKETLVLRMTEWGISVRPVFYPPLR